MPPARTYTVIASRRIEAPAEAVYGVFADYREAHPRVLPPRFFAGLRVVEGGHGAGTVVVVEGKFAGRVRSIRGVVTEPEPGRLLVETYPEEDMETSFLVEPEPGGGACTTTITSVFRRRRGIAGWLEERIVRRLLEGVYREELDRVAAYVAGTP